MKTEPSPSENEIESPCVSVCALDDMLMYCIGCMRTPTEIAYWKVYTPEERTRIMKELPTREFDD